LIKIIHLFRMNSKNFQFLSFILQNRGWCTITEIVKLAYLIDLAAKNNSKIQNKISDFEYIRYYYGPYSKEIQNTLENWIEKEVIKITSGLSTHWHEYTVYEFNIEKSNIIDQLTPDEQDFILETLEDLATYRSTHLTDIAYNTKPMTELWATLWWNEGLHTKIL